MAWIASCRAEPPAASLASEAEANAEEVDCAGIPIEQADVNRDNVINILDLTAAACHMGKELSVDVSRYSAEYSVRLFYKLHVETGEVGNTVYSVHNEEFDDGKIQTKTNLPIAVSLGVSFFYGGVRLRHPGAEYKDDDMSDGLYTAYRTHYVGDERRFTFEDFNRQANPLGWKYVNPEGWSVEMLKSIYYENFPSGLEIDSDMRIDKMVRVLDADDNQVDGAIVASRSNFYQSGYNKDFEFMFVRGAEDMNISKVAFYNDGGKRVYEREIEVIKMEGGSFDMRAKAETVNDMPGSVYYLTSRDEATDAEIGMLSERPPEFGYKNYHDLYIFNNYPLFSGGTTVNEGTVTYTYRWENESSGCPAGQLVFASVYRDPIIYQATCE